MFNLCVITRSRILIGLVGTILKVSLFYGEGIAKPYSVTKGIYQRKNMSDHLEFL